MSEKNWSKYQQDVFEFVRSGKGHGVVLARAGSGKTTTIVEACKCASPDSRVLFVAFNKSIADELGRRVPGNTTASTLHSYGFRAVRAAWRGCRVDGDRERKMAEAILPKDVRRETVQLLCKLVSMAKAWLVEDTKGLIDLSEGYQCTGQAAGYTPENWTALAQHILKLSKSEKDGTVSFDDMVWLPVVLKLAVPRYDLILVDETQDLNRCQVELVLMAAGEIVPTGDEFTRAVAHEQPALRGRILAVGDDRQAIYAFRGADSASIERLTERLQAKVMPLSITYRCPRAVVAMANKWVPDLEPATGAIDGEIVEGFTPERLLTTVEGPDFVLSRTNAPLASLCLKALKAGKRAFIRGRDIGAGLTALVRKSRTRTTSELAVWLDGYLRQEEDRLRKANKPERIEEVADRVGTIEALSEGLVSTDELVNRIEQLFDDRDPAGRIMFSSTHKAKGLESDRVFLLWSTYRPQQGREEENIAYVAVTRAKRTLVFVNLPK